MRATKSKPIIYVKLFALLYIAVNMVANILHRVALANIFQIRVTFGAINGILISYIPIVLFLICVFKFNKSKSSYIFLTVSYVASVLMCILSVVDNVKHLSLYGFFDSFTVAISSVSGLEVFINTLLSIAAFSLTIILLYTCLNRFKTIKAAKISLIIEVGIEILNILYGFGTYFLNGTYYKEMFFAAMLISISSLLANAAHMIFWFFAIDKERVLIRNTNIPHSKEIDDVPIRFCSGCGSRLSDDVRFCEQCGNRANN